MRFIEMSSGLGVLGSWVLARPTAQGLPERHDTLRSARSGCHQASCCAAECLAIAENL